MSTPAAPQNPARTPVEVVPYDPNWPQWFATIKSALSTYLDGVPYKSIEHVGSTSIPNLPAKAIIDTDIIITEDQVDAVCNALVKNGGYEYRGDRGVPLRYMMNQPADSKLPKHHLYVCVDGCASLRNHLCVRDVLMNDEQLRNEYAEVKLGLAQSGTILIDDYIEGKSAILQKILRKAGALSEEELEGINEVNKSVVNRLRDVNSSFSGVINSTAAATQKSRQP